MAIVGFMRLTFYAPFGLEYKQQIENINIDGLEYKQMSTTFILFNATIPKLPFNWCDFIFQ